MPLTLPDPNRTVGDSGHTSDTNLIINALNSLQSAIDAINVVIDSQFYTGTPAALGSPTAGVVDLASRGDHAHLMPSFTDVGAASTTDSRLSDARTPTAHKTSHSTGGSDALVASDIGAAPATGISPSAITGTAVVTADSRLSDARTPTAHKTSHSTGGSDALVASDIGAAPATGISPSAITGTAVITTDARLSDARTPTTHATSHQSGGSDALTLAAAQVTGTAIVQSLVDAKGDLIVGTADNTVARLPVGGTNGFVLTVDSAQASGLTWAVAAAPVADPFPVGFLLGGM